MDPDGPYNIMDPSRPYGMVDPGSPCASARIFRFYAGRVADSMPTLDAGRVRIERVSRALTKHRLQFNFGCHRLCLTIVYMGPWSLGFSGVFKIRMLEEEDVPGLWRYMVVTSGRQD